MLSPGNGAFFVWGNAVGGIFWNWKMEAKIPKKLMMRFH
jgi:hypothetical protein